MSDTPTARLVVRREPEVFEIKYVDSKNWHEVWGNFHKRLTVHPPESFAVTFIDAERAADDAWNEKIHQLKLDAVCSEIPESVTGEDIRLDIADWLDKRLRPIAEREEHD